MAGSISRSARNCKYAASARQRSPRRKRASNPSDCSHRTRRRKAGSTSWRLRWQTPLRSTPMKSPARLARAIAEDHALESLPGKFLFLVDDGSAPGLRDVGADIRTRGARRAIRCRLRRRARPSRHRAARGRDQRRGLDGARLHPIARGTGVRIASDARLGRGDGRRAVAARLRAHV